MYTLGVDLGGTNIACGIVSADGKIIRKISKKTGGPERRYEDIIKDMAAGAREVCDQAGISLEEIESIGVGSPGTVLSGPGVVVYANNLKMANVPVKADLEGILGRTVYVNNDANCAAFGEAMVGLKGYSYAVMLTLGTGVGGGVIIENKIYEGCNGAGAELGHMSIVKDGEDCTCGRKGCFEAYCSATALIRQTRKAMIDNPMSVMWDLCGGDILAVNGRTAFDAMREGDRTGSQVVSRYIDYLADGVASLINIFQPQVFIIGGGISNEGETLLAPMRERCYPMCYGNKYTPVAKIYQAKLGNDAGIIGAAMLYKNA